MIMEPSPTITLNNESWHESHPPSQIAIPYRPLENHRLDKLFNRFIKRSMDILLGSALVFMILSWVLPLMALLIKLDSPGPVFFIQLRTGLRKRSFFCLKFRSMVVNNNADRLEVQEDDDRITRLGYFIRKYHIDELPQLLNVVKGDMSLVGPRPHMLRHTVLYSRLVKNYHDRHRVKPGIAGLAQMKGYHGTISSWDDLYNRCSADFEYIEKWSLFGDLFIFFGTIFKIIKNLFR
jgi:putative colanic acid biosynthesis UDP-glucose lipid carrier transferase